MADITNVVKLEVQLFLETPNATVRSVAKLTGNSKSKVHKHLRGLAKVICPKQYPFVIEKLERNKQERAMRGGLATREKFRQMQLAKKES